MLHQLWKGMGVRIAALLLLVGAPLGAQQTAGTITGKVVDENGAPIAGASVGAAGASAGAITRNDGTYRFTVRQGRYLVRVRLVGYTSGADSVTVTAGQTSTLDFKLAKAAGQLSAVAIVGSRAGERTVLDAPAPIDVLSPTDLAATGRVEVAQMIQMLAPSFNFPRATIGDGTDHSRPATLRGLGADQVLVLVNGKRRHTSALVNVNGTIGRGQAAVDLNAIPAAMIDRIEILRDGAAAQYGSDAIAGVINIILKGATQSDLNVQVGRTNTTLESPDSVPAAWAAKFPNGYSKRLNDGAVATVSGAHSFSFAEGGYLTVGGEFRNRGFTNRSLPDPRTQYFAGDPRNSLAPPLNHRQGDAETQDLVGFLNLSRPLAGDRELYAFGGLSRRLGEAAGFARLPNDNRTVRAIHPDGFLPLIATEISDLSGGVGMKGAMGGWNYDLSTTLGRNSFNFNVENSNNVTLGTASPTAFDAGTLSFLQSTTNLDLTREMKLALPNPVRVAAGAEYRSERYGIAEGEPDSYRDGGRRIIDGPSAGAQGAVGAQVFPGFRPTDAGTHGRSSIGLYLDLENDLTTRWLVAVAGRVERYSDFGSATTGKVATRFKLTDRISLRGAGSTGFRAPSLHQQWFSSTATNFINGVPFEVRTLPVTDPIARALGAKDLTPERSTNFSGGFAIDASKNLSITADYYNIFIADRIVFSENFTGAAATSVLTAAGLTGVSGGRFFTNAINTRTQGAEVVANYGVMLGSTFARFTAAYNFNENMVTRVAKTPAALSTLQEALFGRVERGRIEIGQPKSNVILSTNVSRKGLTLTARAQRFGQVVSLGTAANGSADNILSPKWITDLSASYKFPRSITLTVGADNVLDVYPDPNRPTTANNGIFPYSGISPFGFNGRFIYTRVSVTR
ncbi:MAG: hypothetical protein RLZZ63_1102 [Gemmatimonadota bacterium]